MADTNSKKEKISHSLAEFAPLFEPFTLDNKQKRLIENFFTNLDKPVFSTLIPFPPELIGALCSRTSRAKGDLREIYATEYATPFEQDSSEYGQAFQAYVKFLKKYSPEAVFSNPKAREFYIKWLADYGDDSIAQMAGTYLIYSGISQVAIKHIEDMRIGIAPIEKSTRYVDYSQKINGEYRYYTDPTLKDIGLYEEYKEVMDNLFETYFSLQEKLSVYLEKKYPEEKPRVIRTKVFDTLRGILPTSTLSQVAFFGNGQAFEYLMARTLHHALGEIRWSGSAALEELKKTIPSFLRRAENESAQEYRMYKNDVRYRVQEKMQDMAIQIPVEKDGPGVRLVDYDKDGEDKVIASLIYPGTQTSYTSILSQVKRMTQLEKKKLLKAAMKGRTARWQRVPRAFEMADMVVETIMNIGAWRDEHRHRMKTQIRERFTTVYGFDVPQELKDSGLDKEFKEAIRRVDALHEKIAAVDSDLAQYATVLAHRMRFVQKTNLRALFWETELRSGSQGHPDYRKTAHAKAKLIQKYYPILAEYLLVDWNTYEFARRGTEERMKKKEEQLKKLLTS